MEKKINDYIENSMLTRDKVNIQYKISMCKPYVQVNFVKLI